jgi:uncharacterized membrane protein
MLWLTIVVQWLHVFSGIFWFGGTLYLDFVIIPAVMGLPREQQPAVSKRIGAQSVRVILPVATLVILLGLLRGTVFGPVRSFDFLFGTAYGITFFVGFLASLATYAWGLLVITPTAKKLEVLPIDEKTEMIYNANLKKIKIFGQLELIGFLAILTCMILMRFGY